MNHETRDFHDGILTAISRQVVLEPENVQSWIICDGDVDPEWIEALNSVLDDNHLLTLPNGERISFGSNVNFIFETHDLRFASPATISRMGMMFLSNEDVNTKALVAHWILSLPEDKRPFYEKIFEDKFDKCLSLMWKNENNMVIETTRVGSINNVLSLLKGISSDIEFQFRITQGILSNMKVEKHNDLLNEFEAIFGNDKIKSLDFTLKDRQLIPLTYDENEKVFISDDTIPCVKTIQTLSKIEIIKTWVRNNEPFIVAGSEGCGKEMIIQETLNTIRNDVRIKEAKIYCNSQIKAKQIIDKLYEYCVKATFAGGRILKPKDCNRLVLFLKDINLPSPDKYQTTQAISLLQQILTHKGFYDENLEYIHLDEKIQIIATLNPVVSFGRNKLSTRFTANMRIVNLTSIDPKEMYQIYDVLTHQY